jgi:predicted PolB exonuclease-like 3'-5' exonuclease
MIPPRLVFDLETVPDLLSLRTLRPEWQELDDVSLFERFVAEREQEFFPLHLQKIVAIACVLRWEHHRLHIKSLGTTHDDEASLLRAFFALIEKYRPQLISWNGHGFDQPVLHYRSMIHSIPAYHYWNTRTDKWNHYLGRYHDRHLDLMDMLAKYNTRAFVPLDQLAKLCGAPGKMGADGGQVHAWYQEGRLNDIRHYCETDVLNTWLVALRFNCISGTLDTDGYEQELSLVHQWLNQQDQRHWQEFSQLMGNVCS